MKNKISGYFFACDLNISYALCCQHVNQAIGFQQRLTVKNANLYKIVLLPMLSLDQCVDLLKNICGQAADRRNMLWTDGWEIADSWDVAKWQSRVHKQQLQRRPAGAP